MTALYVILALVALAALWVVVAYNGLVGARNRVDEAWSDVDVQLKRRHDLVPNLVATVKGYADHESSVLTAVTEARAAAVAARSPAQRADAEARLTAAVNAVAEQYPQLRAVEAFARLQAELTQLEDEIQAARRIYNGNVQRYQTRKQQFPASVVATRGPFADRELFTLDSAAERTVPQVAFA